MGGGLADYFNKRCPIISLATMTIYKDVIWRNAQLVTSESGQSIYICKEITRELVKEKLVKIVFFSYTIC